MKRIIIYPAVFMILIAVEAFFTWGMAFDFNTYTLMAWVFQILLVLMCLGLAELWVRDWEKNEKN